MVTRNPPPARISMGSFGLGGPAPRDVLIILGVLFVTFALQFFQSTRIVPAVLQLTPLAWRAGWVWQLATYPFIGAVGSGIWFLLDLLFLYIFGKDVYFGLYRRHFWRLILFSTIGAALVAVGVHALLTLTGMLDVLSPSPSCRGSGSSRRSSSPPTPRPTATPRSTSSSSCRCRRAG